MMITTTPDWRALIPRYLAVGTTCIEGHSADTATFFRRFPFPHAHCVHVIVLDLHGFTTIYFWCCVTIFMLRD